MARADGVVCLAAAALAACAAPAYSPCPLDLGHALPADAFARCRDVLLRRYDALTAALGGGRSIPAVGGVIRPGLVLKLSEGRR